VKTNRTWWSLTICLSAAVAVALSFLVLVQHLETRRPGAAVSRRSLAQRGHHALPHGLASEELFDPVLVYSSFLGGTSSSNGLGEIVQYASVIYVDSSDNLYLAGRTISATFPTTPGTVQPAFGTGSDSFLVKVDPTGQHLLLSTYVPSILGGVTALAVDTTGDIYVAGPSNSVETGVPPLPFPSGSTPFASSGSIGVLELNPTATKILAATYVGGSGGDYVGGIALDSSNNVYISGTTRSNDLKTKNPLQPSLGTSGDNVFITVLNSSLSAAVYSTYLGANSTAYTGMGHNIAVDASKNVYVTGTAGPGFPVTSGTAAQASCGGSCVFVAKLNPAGSAISYATYLGTTAVGAAVAVDASQNTFVTGVVEGGGFNELNPVSTFPSCNASLSAVNTFVSEINASGALAFSTCFGRGAASDHGQGLALDSSGNVYAVGSGFTGLPLTNPIQSNSGNGAQGAPYVVGINPNTSSLLFASYIGGGQANESDSISDIAVDSAGSIYLAGYDSPGLAPVPFPVFNALQPLPGGFSSCPDNPCGAGNDAIFLKIAPTDAPAAALAPAALTFPAQPLGVASAPSTVTIFDLGSTALTVSNVSATGDFSVQQSCATVTAAGGTCPVQVTFTPTAAGTRTGTLTITDNSAGSPRTVALTGTGGQVAVSVSPASLTFSQAINTTGTSQVTLTNSGNIPLQISTVQVSGATFSESNSCGVSVAAGQSCGITVSFSPTALGNSTGTLTITDSDPGSPHTVPLTGTGVADSLGLAYCSLNGCFSTQTVSAGSVALTAFQVGGAGVAGDVSLSCSGLPQGASCSFAPSSTVQITATAAREINLTITTTSRSQIFGPIVLTTGLTMLAASLILLFFRKITAAGTPRLRWRFVPIFALAICACGGGNGSSPNGGGGSSSGTPAGSHVITITATSGSSTSQTLLFNLVVQ
jgi:hypothetical protein